MILPNSKNFCGGNFQDWLEVNLIDKCNGSCSWCVEKNGFHPRNHASWHVLADRIIESGKKNVILLGGEPTLYLDLGNLVMTLKMAKINVFITTNGSMLSRDFILEHLRHLNGINISIHHHNLDKNKEITGIKLDWSKLKLAIIALRVLEIPVRFNCNCIDKYIDSADEMAEYIDWAKDFGVNSIRFAELKLDDENFVDLAKILRHQHGLNDDPFVLGCHQDTVINGMPVNFRQMCGLQTKKRPQHQDVKQYLKQVLYYDGIIYDGWQTQKDELMNKKPVMAAKDVLKIADILQRVKNNELKVEEGILEIEQIYVDNIKENVPSDISVGSGGCQY